MDNIAITRSVNYCIDLADSKRFHMFRLLDWVKPSVTLGTISDLITVNWTTLQIEFQVDMLHKEGEIRNHLTSISNLLIYQVSSE